MTLKEQIIQLRNEKKTYQQIMETLGCSKGTIAFHIGKGVRQKQVHRQSINRKKFGDELKQLHGAKCKVCDYDRCLEALEFHHINPTTKKFEVMTHGKRGNKKDIIAESYKCMLVCSNCHRELHTGIISIDIN